MARSGWDPVTHRQIGGPLTGHSGVVYSVTFSPDGKTLAAGADDKTIRTWNVTYVAHIVPDRYLSMRLSRTVSHTRRMGALCAARPGVQNCAPQPNVEAFRAWAPQLNRS